MLRQMSKNTAELSTGSTAVRDLECPFVPQSDIPIQKVSCNSFNIITYKFSWFSGWRLRVVNLCLYGMWRCLYLPWWLKCRYTCCSAIRHHIAQDNSHNNPEITVRNLKCPAVCYHVILTRWLSLRFACGKRQTSPYNRPRRPNGE